MALDLKDNALAKLIGVLILALVGIALATSIADNVVSMDDTVTTDNESISIASSRGTIVNTPIRSVTQFMNGTTSDSTPIVNETISMVSGIGITTNDDLINVSLFGNATWLFDVNEADFNFTTNGTIYSNDTTGDLDYVISYTYIGESTFWTVTADDFNFTKRAGIVSVNESVVDGNYLISYIYEPDTFVDSPIAITLVTLVILLFVLGILLFVIAWFTGGGVFDIFKKE